MYQSYPNPTSNETIIEFRNGIGGNISIVLYDNFGRYVREITNDYYNNGLQTVSFNISDLKTGIYYYVMKTEFNEKFSKKITILK